MDSLLREEIVEAQRIIQNYPRCIMNFVDTDVVISTAPKSMPGETLEELNQIRYKKPDGRAIILLRQG